MSEPTYIVSSLLLASVLSASGAAFILLGDARLDEWKRYLTSLSVGAILGGAFIHLIPRYAAGFCFSQLTGLAVVLSLVGSYAQKSRTLASRS